MVRKSRTFRSRGIHNKHGAAYVQLGFPSSASAAGGRARFVPGALAEARPATQAPRTRACDASTICPGEVRGVPSPKSERARRQGGGPYVRRFYSPGAFCPAHGSHIRATFLHHPSYGLDTGFVPVPGLAWIPTQFPS